MTVSSHKYSNNYLNLFEWIDRVEIKQVKTARLILKLIPAQCPFARKLKMFDRVILTIPPLCKLNPAYEQLMGLRWRALCFLQDSANDISGINHS
jgi:hypothetical protein